MIDASKAALPHTPTVPFDPDPGYYAMQFGYALPLEYTGWKDEVLSWKQTAYIHGGLNPTPTVRVRGPDAMRILSDHCVNSFARFPVGAAKHAIMCNDDGLIMAHGVLVRKGEDDFMTYWLMPWLGFVVDQANYDVQLENLTGKVFLYQVAGPRSLEILEAATGQDLRDIRFLRERSAAIAGADVSIGAADVDVLRLGMAGSLAYEVHGPIEEAASVYAAILKAGEPLGLRRLGRGQYNMNHTENGFPQAFVHFLYPWTEHAPFMDYLATRAGGTRLPPRVMRGSAGQDAALRYRNPIELGWGHVVKFDHPFVGRAALEQEAAAPRRKMVTLVWNHDDILDVYRSHFQTGEEFQFMDFVQQPVLRNTQGCQYSDLVLKDGRVVGISSGRTYSYYYRRMISLCSIDIDQGELSNEVVILWGDDGTRQKQVRATVERFPYYNENRNETVDVSR